ncbi:MAG: hypothetical protein HC812_18765 [Leptolyngbya sp. RL_3_1]|nr:hypothetical protein [Leptolyngbya sp. RL_3_1]
MASRKPLQPTQFAPWLQDLQPEILFPSFVAGSITGVIGVIRAISYAALIFRAVWQSI